MDGFNAHQTPTPHTHFSLLVSPNHGLEQAHHRFMDLNGVCTVKGSIILQGPHLIFAQKFTEQLKTKYALMIQ